MTPLQRGILISALLLQGAALVLAQDASDEPADDPPAGESAGATEGDDAAAEPLPAEPATGTDDSADQERVLETDDESYLDIDEKDFTPSEEIPTDQSISFPVDI